MRYNRTPLYLVAYFSPSVSPLARRSSVGNLVVDAAATLVDTAPNLPEHVRKFLDDLMIKMDKLPERFGEVVFGEANNAELQAFKAKADDEITTLKVQLAYERGEMRTKNLRIKVLESRIVGLEENVGRLEAAQNKHEAEMEIQQLKAKVQELAEEIASCKIEKSQLEKQLLQNVARNFKQNSNQYAASEKPLTAVKSSQTMQTQNDDDDEIIAKLEVAQKENMSLKKDNEALRKKIAEKDLETVSLRQNVSKKLTHVTQNDFPAAGCSKSSEKGDQVHQETVDSSVKVFIKIRPIKPEKKLLWQLEGSTLRGLNKEYDFGEFEICFIKSIMF